MIEANNETMEFEHNQGRRRMRRVALSSFSLLMIAATLVITLLQMSGYAGTMEDTQLGFNAEIIKNYFSLMDPASMGLFVTANLVDYLFMLSYGIFVYSVARLISWDYNGGIPKRAGNLLAYMGVIAAALDGIENVFLLSMTADPVGFAAWLALGHSSFAFAKFLFMYTAMGWTMVGFILNRTPLSNYLIAKSVL